MKYLLIFLSVFFFLISILGCNDVYEKKLSNGYWIWALDSKEDASLLIEDGEYRIGIVSPTIFAYAENQDFIAVAQRNPINKNNKSSLTERYFIIPLIEKLDDIPQKNLIGPMSKDEFNQKIKSMNFYFDGNFIVID